MAEPGLVADCVSAMQAATTAEVTVKHRIGIDDRDSYDQLAAFVATVAAAGCRVFVVHARKAWLQGLSPKQNREVPPLRYAVVHALKRDFPNLRFVINGGFQTLAQASAQLARVDGVMIGREAYRNPWMLAEADRQIFAEACAPATRRGVVERMLPFIERTHAAGVPVHRVTRHMLGLFQGQPGARAWRRHLSEHAHRPDATPAVVAQALDFVT
jgi:tRNA-dihydrouridine synthase A